MFSNQKIIAYELLFSLISYISMDRPGFEKYNIFV